jgi:putative flippase GtrA
MEKFAKYCFVGIIGVMINLTLVYFLTEIGTWYIFSALIGFLAAVSNNFIWNKLWTFKNKVSGKKNIAKQYGKFFTVSLIGLGMNLIVLYFLTEGGIWYLHSQLIAIIATTGFNFIGNKYWTFGESQ